LCTSASVSCNVSGEGGQSKEDRPSRSRQDILVFCSPTGTALDAANVRRAFRLVTTASAQAGDH
jgi:hypothetical protein